MAKRSKANGKHAPKRYKSYMFIDKDPAIDEMRTLVQSHFGGKLANKQLKNIEVDGGPAMGTMAGWFFKGTKRPQNATLEAAGRAMGYHRPWRRMPK